MMVFKLLCYLAHCWHCILLLFHFGRMYRSCNQNCYCKCYCSRKIFHFGRVCWSGKPAFCYFTLGGCWGSERQSAWNYWYIMAPWLEMWPVPPQWCTLVCQDVVASPSVSCTSYNANLPFILPWKEIDFSPITSARCVFARLALSWLLVYLACNAIKDWWTTVKSPGLAFLVVRLLPWSISDGDGSPSPSGCALKPVRASWWLLPELLAFSKSLFMVWICLSMKPLLCG